MGIGVFRSGCFLYLPVYHSTFPGVLDWGITASPTTPRYGMGFYYTNRCCAHGHRRVALWTKTKRGDQMNLPITHPTWMWLYFGIFGTAGTILFTLVIWSWLRVHSVAKGALRSALKWSVIGCMFLFSEPGLPVVLVGHPVIHLAQIRRCTIKGMLPSQRPFPCFSQCQAGP